MTARGGRPDAELSLRLFDDGHVYADVLAVSALLLDVAERLTGHPGADFDRALRDLAVALANPPKEHAHDRTAAAHRR